MKNIPPALKIGISVYIYIYNIYIYIYIVVFHLCTDYIYSLHSNLCSQCSYVAFQHSNIRGPL